MVNSRFSTLIYRIIGKPDRWHDDYIDVMHQVLDETESFDDPANFSELAIGEQIISRINGTSEALTAFNTVLNESRFKMIILDEHLSPIYRNQNATDLYNQIVETCDNKQVLKYNTQKLVSYAAQNLASNQVSLMAIDTVDENGDQLYLRVIKNRDAVSAKESTFYLVMVYDQVLKDGEGILSAELVSQYELTVKEQNVLIELINGRNVKEMAEALFVSDNTIKTHLKSLFRKTGSKSQADVIRLVLTHESQVLDSYFDPSMNALSTSLKVNDSDKSIVLSSGLKVSYCEYGPENGDPIVVCHNGYGCRMMVPSGYEAVLKKHNKRLIIPERSGTGLTPFEEGHPEKWNAEFGDFIDALDLGDYEVMGAVLGSVFALLHAVEADERLKRVHLASPVFVNTRSDMDYLTGIFAPSVRLVRASKRFAREIYELWLKSVTMNLNTNYRSMIEKSLGEKEREKLIENNTLKSNLDLMVSCFQNGASQTIDGISHDMVFCISPRKVDLSKVTAPVEMWWGTQDTRISREGVENLASQLSDVNLNICEGYSEHLYYSLFDELLSK